MQIRRLRVGRMIVAASVVLIASAISAYAMPGDRQPASRIDIAQASDREARELQPRYDPVPPPEKSWYNDSYIFAATRGVADSTLIPTAKVALYTLTVPLDLLFLPFAAIGGLFG